MTTPLGMSSSASVAITGTRARIVPVSELSVTVPCSSTFSIVIVTSCMSSMLIDGCPSPSSPSCTSTVTL